MKKRFGDFLGEAAVFYPVVPEKYPRVWIMSTPLNGLRNSPKPRRILFNRVDIFKLLVYNEFRKLKPARGFFKNPRTLIPKNIYEYYQSDNQFFS